jgi:putative transposase
MMCRIFGLSRAAYYAWRKRTRCQGPDPRHQIIQEAYQTSHRTYGYRRIGAWIKRKYGITINHKAVLRIMNHLGIHSIARRRKPYPKPNQLKTYHTYPNIMGQDFSAEKPNQKWVTDITFIRTQQGWAYLSAIKDLYDNFIVAHKMSLYPSVKLVTDTIKLAKSKVKTVDGVLLHSDQGFQYTSQPYFVLANELNILPSMSRRGNCYDNACIENFFGHLKQEALQLKQLPSYEDLQIIVNDYICFYNYERLQLKTSQTPFEVRCLAL